MRDAAGIPSVSEEESSMLPTLDCDDRRLAVGVDFGCDRRMLASLCRLTAQSFIIIIMLNQYNFSPQ